jgi:hypothetical protein
VFLVAGDVGSRIAEGDAMKIFICWSTNRGLQFAEATQRWITGIFADRVQATLSVNIEKGAVWFEELSEALRQARVGLICLTAEAVTSPWIHFEAGILAKTLHEDVRQPATTNQSTQLRIFPFLNGVELGALKGPLSAYQTTSAADKDDAWRLIETVLSVLVTDRAASGAAGTSEPEPPSRKTVHRRFEETWDAFQADLRKIEPAKLAEIVPEFERLFQRKTFNESMYDCLTQGWLERHNRARDVHATLSANQPVVRRACRRYVADMFDALMREVDAYTMCLGVLLGRERLPIEDTGRLKFDERGVAVACEGRRTRIKNLVARLADERQAPFFDEAFQFEAAETLPEKKRLLNRKAADIRHDKEAFNTLMQNETGTGIEEQRNKDRCRDSEWDFDRVVYYVWQEETSQELAVEAQLRCARGELERIVAGIGDPLLLTLHHGLRTLKRAVAMSSNSPLKDEVITLSDRILAVAKDDHPSAIACEIRQTVADLRMAVGRSAPASVPSKPTAVA